MNQEYRKTLLIVCEGARSEPDYFHNLRNEVIEKCGADIFIKILPIPSQEKIDQDAENFEVRKGGRKRRLKETSKPVEDYSVENEYKAQPTCYVRKAQLAYLESNYDELWAVYDKDGHPNHEEAFNLSLPSARFTKKVNIGFSSISFEVWLLLHFEYSTSPFEKSQCRNQQKKAFNCGTHTYEEDCKGAKCVVGKIVESQYLNYSDSKFFDYQDYYSHYITAAENAILLRENSALSQPFYELNPYITVDKLVFKLKYFDKLDHVWNEEKTFIIDNNVICSLNLQDGVCIVEILNNSQQTYLWGEGEAYLINANYDIILQNTREIIGVKGKAIFTFNIFQENFSYLVVKNKPNEANIFDRDFVKRL